jgi:photosystem II stability/assembly factor-like uncharacterized protein
LLSHLNAREVKSMSARAIIALNYKHLVFARQDGNGSWTSGSSEIGHRTTALAVQPNDPNTIYVGTDGKGVLKTDDYGESWTPIGLDGQIVRSLATSKLEAGTIYAGTKPAALYVSRDYGERWQELPSFRRIKKWYWLTPAEWPPSGYVMKITLSPTDPQVIVAGIEAAGLLRSVDGGQTWTGHPKGAVRDCHDLTFHPTDGQWVYEGGGGSAAFSRDGGQTWTQPDPFNLLSAVTNTLTRRNNEAADMTAGKLDRRYGWAVGADPAQPNIWYFSASTGPGSAHGEGNAQAYIYRCQDGRHWQRLSGGLPQPLEDMPYALLTDVAAPGHVYAVLQNGDVWHSENLGDGWTQLPVNLDAVWYRAVLI